MRFLWRFYPYHAKGFLNFKSSCLSQLFPLYLNTYVMDLRPLEIILFFQRGSHLYTSESDVYRRQIPTYKDGPRAVRVKNTLKTMILYIYRKPGAAFFKKLRSFVSSYGTNFVVVEFTTVSVKISKNWVKKVWSENTLLGHRGKKCDSKSHLSEP